MIVRQFLQWIQTALPGDRADATSALARAYLHSELTQEDRLAAEAAMTVLLDDPSPLVRRALADALSSSANVPQTLVLALANDQPEIAEIVVARSPLFTEAELVDLIGEANERIQNAIASRVPVPASLAAAVAEVGCAGACLVLIENPDADVTSVSLARIAQRHGALAAIRERLLVHPELPVETRQALVATLSSTLARFVIDREWLPEERAQKVTREACDRATVALAAETEDDRVAPLVRHLRSSGQLTGGLVLRALLSGNVHFLVEALADLTNLSPRRVAAILDDPARHAFRALYERAGLPHAAFGAFKAALEVIQEMGFDDTAHGYAVLRRRIVERVLERYQRAAPGELDQLLSLLRRLAAEATRDEARSFTADLVAAA
ncbi:MAG TPA: DUF2336 domain-containing protein [Xanthobacteraceae bacterium]|jgi:uncharacterized protein (DUF2336 family)